MALQQYRVLLLVFAFGLRSWRSTIKISIAITFPVIKLIITHYRHISPRACNWSQAVLLNACALYVRSCDNRLLGYLMEERCCSLSSVWSGYTAKCSLHTLRVLGLHIPIAMRTPIPTSHLRCELQQFSISLVNVHAMLCCLIDERHSEECFLDCTHGVEPIV